MEKLTEYTQYFYNKKKEAMLNFLDAYDSPTALRSMFQAYYLIRNFSAEEICTEGFLKDFYVKITSSLTGPKGFMVDILEYLTIDDENKKFFNKLSTDDRVYLIKLFEEAIEYEATNLPIYSFSAIINFFNLVCGNAVSSENLFTILLDKHFFTKCKIDVSSAANSIDDVVISGTIENPENFISAVLKEYPDYLNFPAIVLNPNISEENKIKAIKLTYKQKDFPKYKELFREKLKDLKDLDAFIEATIFQNNRVREKEACLIKLIKDIFISSEPFGPNKDSFRYYYMSSDECEKVLEKLVNKKYFSEKYMHYFINREFMVRLYNETCNLSTKTYSRKYQYKAFFKEIIFKEYSLKEKLELTKDFPQYECIFEDIQEYIPNILSNNDEEGLELVIRRLAINSSGIETMNELFYKLNTRSAGYSYTDVISRLKDTDILDKYFENLKILKYGITKSGSKYGTIPSNIIEKLESILTDKTLLEKITLIEPSEKEYFGLNYEKIRSVFTKWMPYNLESSSYASLLTIYNIFTRFLENDKKANKDIAKIIYEKYFNFIENVVLMESFNSNVLNFQQDSELRSFYYDAAELNYKHISISAADAFKKLISLVKDGAIAYNSIIENRPDVVNIISENYSNSLLTIDCGLGLLNN